MGLKNFSYSHTIGIASFLGRGFMNPVDVRLDSEGLLFVLSRSNAGNKDVRVSVQTLDSEYMYEFGRWGTDPGQTTQPTAIVLDGDDRGRIIRRNVLGPIVVGDMLLLMDSSREAKALDRKR